MTPKQVVQWLIVIVIVTMIVWSVVNVSHYAGLFHDSWIVWTFGLSVGIANAVSVYVFVIATTPQQKRAAVSGIFLFGGASGFLQMFLYQHEGADLMTAILFGWFGPVAEGVLSWLHAALSEVAAEPVVTVTTPKVDKPVTEPVTEPTVSDAPVVTDKPLKTTGRRDILRRRIPSTSSGTGKPSADDIDSWSKEFGVSARTVFRDIEALTESAPKMTNGAKAVTQ